MTQEQSAISMHLTTTCGRRAISYFDAPYYMHETRAINAISNPIDFQDRMVYGIVMVELVPTREQSAI